MALAKKPRTQRNYRVLWNDDGGQSTYYHPPLSPAQFQQAHLGYLEGTPVDAYMCAVGYGAGYTTAFPSGVAGAGFIVDHLKEHRPIGHDFPTWRYAETMRHLWELGRDPIELLLEEARRIGVDFFLQLRLNDWHHLDLMVGGSDEPTPTLTGSAFYDQNPVFRIGRDRVPPPASDHLRRIMGPLQDFRHDAVRQFRLDLMRAACERYDVDGFELDFMRMPLYFRHGETSDGISLMNGFVAQARSILDQIGAKRNKPIALAVRVPGSFESALSIGLDVTRWMSDRLVDAVIPSTFLATAPGWTAEPWVQAAHRHGVRVYPCIEESHLPGYTDPSAFFGIVPAVPHPLTPEMSSAIAANHWRDGADGVYTFNWAGCEVSFGLNTRLALDNIGDSRRLTHRNKRYIMMRPQAFPTGPASFPLPVEIVETAVAELTLFIADDLKGQSQWLRRVVLNLWFDHLTILDDVEVRLNGIELIAMGSPKPGDYACPPKTRQQFDLINCPPVAGGNVIAVRLRRPRDSRLLGAPAIVLSDMELNVTYRFPNGAWERSE